MPAWLHYLLLSVVALLLFISSVALVVERFNYRQWFYQLQQLEQQRDELQIEWQQLQLEHSAWATPARIEKVAKQQLHMHAPKPEDIIRVSP